MQQSKRGILMTALMIIGLLLLTACSTPIIEATSEPPAVVEVVEGSEFNRVTLSQKAAERLDIQTAAVEADDTTGLSVPYAAIVYGNNGETWVYTSPEALTFMRAVVTVASIDGDTVNLSAGPEAGTAVATVGVAELYGADTGIGK